MEAFVLREYDEWLADHLEELVRRYPSKLWPFTHARSSTPEIRRQKSISG